jgi:hypothetical protein
MDEEGKGEVNVFICHRLKQDLEFLACRYMYYGEEHDFDVLPP